MPNVRQRLFLFMKHSPDIHARLTPAMRLLVERMAQAPHPPMHTLTAAEAKAAYALSIGILDVPQPELARVGEPGRGVRQILAMCTMTRLDCALGPAG